MPTEHPPVPPSAERVTDDDVARYLANRQAEIDSATLYRALAGLESQPTVAAAYAKLADSELKHAAFWETRLEAAGRIPPPSHPSWRARLLVALGKRFGPQFILPTVIGRENMDAGEYDRQPESRGTVLPSDERSHARVLQALATPQGAEGTELARLEGRHRSVGGNALRAAVLGANDGLVSNLSLVMGVAGAAVSGRALLVTGLAGLIAGAGSMAMGEWLSVQSSRELNQHQLDIEAEELAAHPEEEGAELALIYQAKGLPEAEARALAARILPAPSALSTLAREELGINPAELGGSAWEAAATSFVLFAAGAIIPVLPFFAMSGTGAIVVSVVISAVALFVIGAGITLLTGRGVLYSGGRQLVFGLIAAALTFGVGRLIGVSIAP